MIKVMVNGAAGKMGRTVVSAVSAEDDLQLVGAVDNVLVGRDIGSEAVGRELGVIISNDPDLVISSQKPDVMVDFTNPMAVMENITRAARGGVHCVVGTTGFDSGRVAECRKLAAENGINMLLAPNFALGAVLMMKFAAEAARHFKSVEIIELHHEKKMDFPSGTAIKTAEMILEAGGPFNADVQDKIAKVPGARGADMGGIRLHSVRLPGFVAHQEVIFGGLGQTLTLRHDSLSRESFMPGVLLAVRRVQSLNGVVVGLENIL